MSPVLVKEKVQLFELKDVEIETVRRAAADRNLPFDPNKREYSREELKPFGLVREGYDLAEMRDLGIRPKVVSSHDQDIALIEDEMLIETPFGKGIRKWQLPIDMFPIRVAKTVFSPGSIVERHVHPPHSEEQPGGGFRIVISGCVFFEGQEYRCGDWFFVPNGVPYEFTTDPNVETVVFYKYSFFGVAEGNRFSHPHKV